MKKDFSSFVYHCHGCCKCSRCSGRLRFFFQQHGFFCGFFRCIQRSNFLCRIYG